MDFLGAVYRAVRITVKSSFAFKEKNYLSISSGPAIKYFYYRHGNLSLTHQLHLHHTTRNRHPGGQIIYEQPHAQHILSFLPLRSHGCIQEEENIIFWSMRLLKQPSHGGPWWKQGSLFHPCRSRCSRFLLSSLCLHQFFHSGRWVKAIASCSARALVSSQAFLKRFIIHSSIFIDDQGSAEGLIKV